MERNNPVGRWCTKAGLRKLTEATPMALPDMLMIGDPDIPGSKNASGVKASQPPLRTTRPSRQWPSSDSTRASPYPPAPAGVAREANLQPTERSASHFQHQHSPYHEGQNLIRVVVCSTLPG